MKHIIAFFRRFIHEMFYGGKEYRTVKGKKSPFPFGTVLGTALVTVLLLTVTFLLIRISDVSAELSSMKKEAVALEKKENDLRDELERKYPLAEREAAAEALGFSRDNGETVILPPETEKDQTELDSEEK